MLNIASQYMFFAGFPFRHIQKSFAFPRSAGNDSWGLLRVFLDTAALDGRLDT
jgi:hypothetical protein